MKSFVKHVSAERARLRHPLFSRQDTRKLAFEILQKQEGIAGIKQGPESFLLFLEPGSNMEQICMALEEGIPSIHEDASAASKASTKRIHPYRKLILKTYLATGITTVTLAVMGFYHWHKFFGWVFTAFAIDHVWVRRKAL